MFFSELDNPLYRREDTKSTRKVKPKAMVGGAAFAMKLDFLGKGADNCPMVRLDDFRSSDVQDLIMIFEALATGAIRQASVGDDRWPLERS